MAVAQLALKYRNGAVQPSRIVGSSPINIGGPLNREVAHTASTENATKSKYGAQIGDTIWFVHTRSSSPIRFYRFSSTARILRITAALGGSGTFAPGETITGTNSGATGTTVETYVGTETFVVYEPVGGTFQNNDPLTFTGGATATTTASGNPENNGGDCYIDFETSFSIAGDLEAHSALQEANLQSGQTGLCFFFQRSTSFGGQWATVVYDRLTDTWTETDRGGSLGSSVSWQFSGSFFAKNLLYLHTNNSTNRRVWFFNPQTDVFGTFTVALEEVHSTMATIRDRVFMAGGQQSTPANLRLIEISGGAGVTIDDVPGGGGFDNWNLGPATNIGPTLLFRGEDDDALYAIDSINQAAGINRQVVRWTIDSGGNFIRNCPITAGQAQIDIGEALLPSVRRTADQRVTDFWQRIRDIESVPGTPDFRFFWFDSFSASGIEYLWQGWTDFADATSSISGTTVTTASPHGLSVGDWVRHNTDNLAFRVASTPLTTTFTIDDAVSISEGWALPTTVSQWSKIDPLLFQSSSGSLIGYAMPDDSLGNGGSSYTVGELHADWAAEPIDILGGETLTIRPYGGGVVKIEVYYMKKDGVITQASLSNPAQTAATPSMNGDTVENVNADGINDLTVDWSSQGDGVTLGEFVYRWIRIFT